MNDALQERRDRQSKMARQIIGLVESALILTAWMQRNRHDEVGALQDARAGDAHQLTKRRRNRPAALVFQRVDDFLHPPFISIDRARPVHALIGAEPIEQRRRQAQIRPAVFADCAVQRMKEWPLARRARRLKERSE
jgi:hypothetical protein